MTEDYVPAEGTPEAETQDNPGALQARLPILPTSVDVAVLDAGEVDVLFINMTTDVVAAMFSLTRSQVIELGAKLLKAGEKMRRRPGDARLSAVRKRLVLPGE